MDITKMREDGIICFAKSGLIWVHVDSEDLFETWITHCGYESVKSFTLETQLIALDIIGHTVSLSSVDPKIVLFADRWEWWDSLDLERIKAVMNERIFGWALSGDFLTHMGELEFAKNVMDQFAKVSGKPVQIALSSVFMQETWCPEKDTIGFLKNVSMFLITELNIKLEDARIQYFV